MNRIYVTFCILSAYLLTLTPAWSQLSKKDVRRFTKAQKRYEAVRYDEAEKLLTPLCKKYPGNSQVWDLLAEVEMMNYYKKSDSDLGLAFSRSTIAVKNRDKDMTVNDTLTASLIRLLNQNLPSQAYFRKAVNNWREATLRCEDAELPSLFLRTFLLDPPPDTSGVTQANLAFHLGENEFQKKNFTEAITHYNEAVALDSTFYKAKLFMGDAYYNKRDFSEASRIFREAIHLRPHLQEPRKFLVDALLQMEAYDEAGQEAIDALIIYPEVSMFLKLQEILNLHHKNFTRHWSERKVFPNTMGDQPLNEKGDRDWMEYINGFSLIEKFCNKDGVIVKTNELTKSHYAEVYSWEYMLSKTSSDKFPFARKMQQAGYLDCYVMFSLYHIDFNPQYQHFARHNKERLKSYVEMLMTM